MGGGPVGYALACAARGLSVALVAREPRAESARKPGELDPRVYAVSPANVAFLQRLRAWDGVPAQRTCPIHAMRVFGDRAGAEIGFDAYRAGLPELACTVEDSVLQDALWQSVRAAGHVELFAPAECRSLRVDGGAARLELADGRALSASLVVGADGARSFVRAEAGIEARETEYGQAALVANFACAAEHGNTAYQWFLGGPVLALLPLPGRRVSMIWSLPLAEAERLAALGPAAFCERVRGATGGLLGELSLLGERRSHVLRRLSARRMIAQRVALAGDAAHVIHPLAGQGLNLGLQDAERLGMLLAAREPVRDPGDARLLRRYERSRAEPILAMDLMVDGLFRLFAAENPAARSLRNAGLNLTGRIPVLKNMLVRRAAS